MADNTPSLGELSNLGQPVRVNPEPYIIDTKSTIDVLNNAANQKAQYDWKKYLNFQDNLKEAYKNLDDTSALKAAQEDRPFLQQEMGKVFSEIADNPEAFSGKNPQLYGQIQSKLSKLKSTATQSAQDKLFDDAHRNYLAQNPELNTDENAALVQGYLKKPLGQREAYTLSLPTLFNADELSGRIIADPSVTSKFATDDELTPDNQFIKSGQKGTISKRDAFLSKWDNSLDNAKDKFNHSIKKAITERYNMLPKDIKSQYPTVKDFFHHMGELQFNSDKDLISITEGGELKANSNYVNPQELALKKATVSQGWARIGLDKAKLDKENDADVVGADSVLREAVSIIDKGTPVTVQDFDGKGGIKQVVEIADPTLLQTFGNIDKDGKTTNVPDVVQYDKDKGQLNLVYYQKDENGAIKKVNGKRQVVDRKPLDERTWLKILAKRSNPNKDIGTVNSLVDQVLTKSGNSLFKVSELYKGNTQQTQQQSNIPTGTMADFKGAGWTDDQIKKAKAAGKIKVN